MLRIPRAHSLWAEKRKEEENATITRLRTARSPPRLVPIDCSVSTVAAASHVQTLLSYHGKASQIWGRRMFSTLGFEVSRRVKKSSTEDIAQ